MKKYFLLGYLILITGVSTLHATTWDEPWAKDVIKNATSFVLGRVQTTSSDSAVTIYILKNIAGQPLKDSIAITDFSLLDLCSASSGHGPEFHIPVGDTCYFFIQKKKGKYCIATPTTGFDFINGDQVAATFRHSYHKAHISRVSYEPLMTAIFNHYHARPFDTAYAKRYIQEWLIKKPAGFSESEINIFFAQHAALESIYHLGVSIDEQLIFPFLADTSNFHNQISGARALLNSNTVKTQETLTSVIADTTRSNFVKVMCIQSLMNQKPRQLKARLTEIAKTASDEGVDFGGNIMDPRICTHLPTVKESLLALILIL